MHKFFVLQGLAIACVAAFASAPASADTLQTYYVQNALFGLNTYQEFGAGTITVFGLSLTGGATASGATVTADGSVDFTSPQPDLTGTSSMMIQFQIVNPNYTSQYGTYVPVVISGNYALTASGTGSAVAAVGINGGYLEDYCCGSAAFTFSASVFFNPNSTNINLLDLNAVVSFSGAVGPGTASALVDPMASIDYSSGNYSDFSLLFAPDALPIAETPLPAALPLFTSGLGALGLLGWRRRKKSAAVAAV